MTKFDLMIIGGGLTAARAIKSYREAGGDGSVALFAHEPTLPYHRPALSKGYLRGETNDTPFVEDESFYGAHGVELMLGNAARSVNTARSAVTAADGEEYRYGKLLIASGAQPRRLRLPRAALDGVHSLRTLADSQSIREAAKAADRAVVVGGGFIGMEVAASLRTVGLEVTLIDPVGRLFGQFGSHQLSDELAALYREHGVELLLGEQVSGFQGRSSLEAVTTASGRLIETGLAVVGIGVVPNVEFLAGSGIPVDNGVVVNERYEAATAVYAAGDVANFFDPVFGRRRRIEHWSNANYQGTQVGAIIAGQPASYETVSSFFTEVFGLSLKVFGDVSRFDALTAFGSLADGDLIVSYVDGGRLVGALTVGQGEDVEARLKEAIAEFPRSRLG